MKISIKRILMAFAIGYAIMFGIRHFSTPDKIETFQVEITKTGIKPIDVYSDSFSTTETSEIKVIDQDTILITGPIAVDTYTKFNKLLTPNIKTVAISSPGGDLAASSGIGVEIYKRHLDTLVPEHGECFSGCTIIFQAGKNRSAYSNTMFMYHSAKSVSDSGKERISTRGTAVYWAYLMLFDADPKLLDQLTDMKADYFITAEYSKEFNIATNVIPSAEMQIVPEK